MRESCAQVLLRIESVEAKSNTGLTLPLDDLRLELCHLFVHVALGEEVNMGASSVELREELQKEKALVQSLRSELRARRMISSPETKC